MCSLAVETEMPGAELELPGPRYEPMSGVQPGSVGELGQSFLPSVLLVESGSTPSSSDSDSDSDSGSEPDLDDPIDRDFVPETPDLSPSPSPGPDMHYRDSPTSPSASSPEPSSSSSSSDSSSDSPEPSPEPGSNAGDPPAPPNRSRDSRTPAPGGLM